MDDSAAAATKTAGRRSLYHFTRASNLPSIAAIDALLCSGRISPRDAGGVRRAAPVPAELDGRRATINAHLRIADSMFDAGVAPEQFRAYLDRHVFFWPTLADLRKMIDTYARREPEERFAVLQFDAYALLSSHRARAKLSKYDSGSSPRFPSKCSYRKSPAMFLPLSRFGLTADALVPSRPSEIREVLIEGRAERLSRYLQAVYVDSPADAPDRWRAQARPLGELLRTQAAGRRGSRQS